MEMPFLKSSEAPRVDVGPEALQHRFVGDLSALVNRDLNDLVAGRGRELPRVDNWVRGCDRKRWADLVTVQLAAAQCAVRHPSLRAVAESGERLCL